MVNNSVSHFLLPNSYLYGERYTGFAFAFAGSEEVPKRDGFVAEAHVQFGSGLEGGRDEVNGPG